jgi:hypothetical protein
VSGSFQIPPSEIAVMADLYNRFAQALEPFTDDRDRAEEGFYQKLNVHYENLLYSAREQHVRGGGDPKLFAPTLSFDDFRRGLILECRRFLKKNK